MSTLTDALVAWIVQNVDPCDVPADEGNADGLVYNLVQLARHGRPYRPYQFGDTEQEAEVARLRLEAGKRDAEQPADEVDNYSLSCGCKVRLETSGPHARFVRKLCDHHAGFARSWIG